MSVSCGGEGKNGTDAMALTDGSLSFPSSSRFWCKSFSSKAAINLGGGELREPIPVCLAQ